MTSDQREALIKHLQDEFFALEQRFLVLLKQHIASQATEAPQPQVVPVPTPVPPPAPVEAPAVPQKAKYDWQTPEAARHSVRVICDEEGLTVEQKNLLSQVIHCESGYNINTTHPNLHSGKVVSTDYGICQWNDYYHGKEMPPSEAMSNPEAAVRLMCKYVKEGLIGQWVCYSSGLYKHYSA